MKLLSELASDTFEPAKYADDYRQRVLELVQHKAEGQEAVAAAPAPARAHVIDLMEALKTSLAQRAADKKPGAKMPAKRAAASASPVPARRAAKR